MTKPCLLFVFLFSLPIVQASEERIEAFLGAYCIRCHGEEKLEADIDLRGPYDQLSLLENHRIWESAIDQIEFEDMPPRKPFPSTPEALEIAAEIRALVTEVDWQTFHDPGRLDLTRLTVDEYRHAIRDIFGVDFKAGHYLGDDPEGNTGFTNDRDSLGFPLFSFDQFLREAERISSLYLGYREPVFTQSIDAVEAWRNSDDGSTELNKPEDAVVISNPFGPFQLNLEVPAAGLYDIAISARCEGGDSLSAIGLTLDGEDAGRLVVTGHETQDYTATLALDAGAHVLHIGYDPDNTPIIQKIPPARKVPKEIEKQIRAAGTIDYPMPDRFVGDATAERAWDRMNRILGQYQLAERLTRHLIDHDLVAYEEHRFSSKKGGRTSRFRKTKEEINLSAGAVSVLLEIPQKKLEKQITAVTGFDYDDYVDTLQEYREIWEERFPERIERTPSRLGISGIVVTSHAGDESLALDPREFADRDESLALVRQLGARAYGRELSRIERDSFAKIFTDTAAESGSETEGLRDAITALLISPPFLLDYLETDSTTVETIRSRRLSRFLWQSLPNDALRDAATNGDLQKRESRIALVDEMIVDPRFAETISLFTDQWLDLDTLDRFTSGGDLASYLVEAMKEEPGRLLHHLFVENRSLLELIDSDYSFLNDALASHYDISAVSGSNLQKVSLETDQRGGLLGMSAILAATSTPERTSPVTRGAFVVELLLGIELPPPPPSVPELTTGDPNESVRDQLARHRDDAACSGCHEKIDPFGFPLENYDPTGLWRSETKAGPIDVSSTLASGTTIDGISELKSYLVEERRDDFVRNLVERFFEFAIGREAKFSDEHTLRGIVAKLEADDYRARTLLHEIVAAEAFFPTP